MAAALTLRSVKGSPLLNSEVDNNFTSLNDFGNVINSNVGVLSNLTTQTKANVVNAINELRGNALFNTGGTITGNLVVNNGNVVVEVTESNPAVRITQLGTGDALVVEDSTNPDATPFIVSADGRLVVGNVSTSGYTSAINVIRLPGGGAGTGTIRLDSASGTGTHPPILTLTRSNTSSRPVSFTGQIVFNDTNTDGSTTQGTITHTGSNVSKTYTLLYNANNIHQFDITSIYPSALLIDTTGTSLRGNLIFNTATTNPRIIGDFSNATDVSRVLVRTSTTNGNTLFGFIPNGTATTSGIVLYNNEAAGNAGNVILTINNSQAALQTAFSGTGTALPLALGTNNITRVTFNVAGGADVATGLRESRTAMAANDIDTRVGNYFTKTISGATTLTVSNVPSSGTAVSFILDLTNGGSATITWWSGMKWAGGTAPTLTASGRDVLGFFTHDGGTTWTGLLLGLDVK